MVDESFEKFNFSVAAKTSELMEPASASCSNWGGGKKILQTDLLTAVSEPLGVKSNALVSVPTYGWAMT